MFKVIMAIAVLTISSNCFSQKRESDSTNVIWLKETINENLNNFIIEQKKASLKFYKFSTFFVYFSNLNFKEKTCKLLIGYQLNDFSLDNLELTNYFYFKRKIIVIIGGKYSQFLDNKLDMPKINDKIITKAKKHMCNLCLGSEEYLIIERTENGEIEKKHEIGYFQLEKEYMFDSEIQSVEDFERILKKKGYKIETRPYPDDIDTTKREDNYLN